MYITLRLYVPPLTTSGGPFVNRRNVYAKRNENDARAQKDYTATAQGLAHSQGWKRPPERPNDEPHASCHVCTICTVQCSYRCCTVRPSVFLLAFSESAVRDKSRSLHITQRQQMGSISDTLKPAVRPLALRTWMYIMYIFILLVNINEYCIMFKIPILGIMCPHEPSQMASSRIKGGGDVEMTIWACAERFLNVGDV